MTEQIKKRAKFEAAVGAGITAIITNYLVKDMPMPEWAFLVLVVLILSYFGNWGMVIVEYAVKKVVDVYELRLVDRRREEKPTGTDGMGTARPYPSLE